MVRKVILLHLPQVSRKFCVVQSVMRAVIEDICGLVRKLQDRIERALTIREGPCNNTVSPRSGEEEMSQSRERVRQRREKERRHNQSQPS